MRQKSSTGLSENQVSSETPATTSQREPMPVAAPIIPAAASGRSDRLQFLDRHKASFTHLLSYQISTQTGSFEAYLNEDDKHLHGKDITPAMEKIFLDHFHQEFTELARLHALVIQSTSYDPTKEKEEYEKGKNSFLLQFKIRILRDKALKAHYDYYKKEDYLNKIKAQTEQGSATGHHGVLTLEIVDFFNNAIKQKIKDEKEQYKKAHITGLSTALPWAFKESWQWTKDKAKSLSGFLSDVYVRNKEGNFVTTHKDSSGKYKPNSIKEIDKHGKTVFNHARKISPLKVVGRVVAGIAIAGAITGIIVGAVAATHGIGVAAVPIAVATKVSVSTLLGTSSGMGISTGAVAGIVAGIAAVVAVGTAIAIRFQKLRDIKDNQKRVRKNVQENRRAQRSIINPLPSNSISPTPSASMRKMTGSEYKKKQRMLGDIYSGKTAINPVQRTAELSQSDSRKSSNHAKKPGKDERSDSATKNSSQP